MGFSSVLGCPGWLFWAGFSALSWGSSCGQKFSFTSFAAGELQRNRSSPGCETNRGQNFSLILPGASLQPSGRSVCHPSHSPTPGSSPAMGFPLPTLTLPGSPSGLSPSALGWFSLPSPATRCEDRLDLCPLRQLEQGPTDGVGNCHGKEGHSPFSSSELCPDPSLGWSILWACGEHTERGAGPSQPHVLQGWVTPCFLVLLQHQPPVRHHVPQEAQL